jgi:hypothetical protein
MVLASAVLLGSESRGTHGHILLFQIQDFPNLEGHFPVFLSPRNGVVQLYPQALGSLFVASYDSRDYGGGIRTCLHVGVTGYNTLVRTAYKTPLALLLRFLFGVETCNVCEVVVYQWLFYSCLFRGCYRATVLHATIFCSTCVSPSSILYYKMSSYCVHTIIIFLLNDRDSHSYDSAF